MDVVTQSLAQISIDWIIFGALTALAAGDALRSGVSRPLALSLSAGLAYTLYASVDTAAFISGFVSDSAYVQAAFAGGIVVLLFILLYRMTDPFGINTSGIVGSTIAGLATAAALVVMWQALPMTAVWEFGAQHQTLFGEAYRFWWLIVAYGAFAFVRR